jgi:putative beta-lysine N-acetyltransferase
MQDKIEIIGKGSKIQHGEFNKRVYLMKLNANDSPFIIQQINNLARKYKYSKIFCKVPEWTAPLFYANGFILEAQIPNFYSGKETAFLVSKFLNSDRLLEIETDKLYEFSKVLKEADKMQNGRFAKESKYQIRKLDKNDTEKITEVYRKVFETYPFPIHSPRYILQTLNEGVQYYAVETEGQMVALSSAEVDKQELNAEMTDFATLPQYRGKGLALMLLRKMEKEMELQGIKTLYTIARLNSTGINKIFLRMGYTFSGTLIKNTNIAGKIESMNVYYKHI